LADAKIPCYNKKIDELEVGKAKAIEMLKSSGGSRMDAVRAYILPAAARA